MVMSPVHQVWPEPSSKAQWKGEEDEADRKKRREDNIREWTGKFQVPEGSGELGKMEKTGCEIICCAPTPLAVQG